jgi:beta-phosphoglucomutase-like phosphatase (HAD superfamily)
VGALFPVSRGIRVLAAAIFDLDGALLESVDLHVLAWQLAMIEFGHDVTFDQVRSQIGKAGDN